MKQQTDNNRQSQQEHLVERFLNGQTTPEEEQLIAQLLRQGTQEEDMEQWLAEDETAAYNRIVALRRTRRHRQWWGAAAAAAVLVATMTAVLWHSVPDGSNTVDTHLAETHTVEVTGCAKVTEPQKADKTDKPGKNHQSGRPRQQANSPDSLEYYIARLEQELADITDSGAYTAKAEQVIRADARLQRLVQRIMIGEITRDGQPLESMNNINETEEEQP